MTQAPFKNLVTSPSSGRVSLKLYRPQQREFDLSNSVFFHKHAVNVYLVFLVFVSGSENPGALQWGSSVSLWRRTCADELSCPACCPVWLPDDSTARPLMGRGHLVVGYTDLQLMFPGCNHVQQRWGGFIPIQTMKSRVNQITAGVLNHWLCSDSLC